MASVINEGLQAKRFGWNIETVFWGAAAIIAVSVFVAPAYGVMLGLLLLAAVAFLILHPVACYYLMILTIPYVERLRFLPVSFSPNDMLVLLLTLQVVIQYIVERPQLSFKTRLDPWLGVLAVVFFLAGMFSASDRGLFPFFKVVEALLVYYITVYFIRTRQTSVANVLKVLLLTALVQAVFGTVQSFANGLGAVFVSDRGYLGYLGLGSSRVTHGEGTMGHFNTLGNYLTTNFLLFLPIYHYVIKRKNWGILLGGLLFMGIITTYSRGSILGLLAGSLFFLSQIQTSRRRSLAVLGSVILLFIVPLALTLGESSYTETVDLEGRFKIWQAPLVAITQSWKTLWLGSGLNSYEVVAWPYIPANIPREQYNLWFAHNFYLLTVLEIGLVGAGVLFGFFAHQWRSTWKQFTQTHGLMRVYNLSLSCAILSIFFVSIFDHSYNSPYFKIFLFLLLGLLYATSTQPSTRVEV